MADVNVTPEVVPVEDVEIDMEAKAKEYDTHTPNEFPLTTEVRNFSRNQVHMVETHFWQGFSTSNSFPALPVNHGVVMHQVAFLASGVKWGIIYADGDQARNRKFIVAVDGMTGKIYVESGPIGPVDWKVVEVKLDSLSDSKADITDPIYGGRIVAECHGPGVWTPKRAARSSLLAARTLALSGRGACEHKATQAGNRISGALTSI